MPERIFFVGLRGSGKTTLGRAVAEALGLGFVDTDDLVVEKAGKTIAEIVAAEGWAAFRARESEALEEASSGTGLVIATGGGIVLAEENRELLKQKGPVFYLMADVSTLRERLEAHLDPDKRPPLTADQKPLDEELRDTLVEREPLYMQVVDFILQAAKPLEELVQDVKERLAITPPR